MENVKEPGKGKTQLDFEYARENSIILAKRLMSKFPWIVNIDFCGDPNFRSGRRKELMKKLYDKGEEISFGLNMNMTYLDFNNIKKQTEVVLKYKPRAPFNYILVKCFVEKATIYDCYEQWKNIWLIPFTGGTVHNPKSVAVVKVGNLNPKLHIRPVKSDKVRGAFRLHFLKYTKWCSLSANSLFPGEGLLSDLLFNSLRGDR